MTITFDVINIMKNNKNTPNSENFYGNIRLYVESAENHTQVDQLCQYLNTVDNLKITSYDWSEKEGLVISFLLKEPTQLGVKLGEIDLVNQVYNKKNDITVVLNNTFTEKTPSILTLPEEQVLGIVRGELK